MPRLLLLLLRTIFSYPGHSRRIAPNKWVPKSWGKRHLTQNAHSPPDGTFFPTQLSSSLPPKLLPNPLGFPRVLAYLASTGNGRLFR